MAGATLVPIDAEKFISVVNQSIQEHRGRGVGFIAALSDPVLSTAEGPIHSKWPGSIRDAELALRTEIVNLGSLPPCPSTWRGRIGLALVRLVDRAIWWQATQHRKFAHATLNFVRTQTAELLQTHTSGQEQLAGRLTELEKTAKDLKRALESATAQVRQYAQALAAETTARQKMQAAVSEALQRTRNMEVAIPEALQRANHDVFQRIAELGVFERKTRAELSVQSRVIERMLESGKTSSPSRGEEAPESRLDDAFYIALQDAFRGPRDEIKSRHRVYLPMLREAGIGTPDRPVLDLGCGRGEWLELLRSEGLSGRGVDSNQATVAFCESLGLPAVHHDGLSFLTELPPASLGAITCFHMIEHIPFERVIALIDDALRALQPGGLLILETPNPRNVLVGTHSFHLDPTHHKPIPSELLWFTMETRGFHHLQRLELCPPPDISGVAGPPEVLERFHAPLDYAIIGERP
jgi:SAM-dependent methyltransferase